MLWQQRESRLNVVALTISDFQWITLSSFILSRDVKNIYEEDKLDRFLSLILLVLIFN